MQYRDFGNTGIKVSEVGFGTWAIGSNEHGNSYGFVEEKAAIEALQKALDLGCNFFDTADVYGWGHSEELLGRAFKGKRDRIALASKVGSDFYQGIGFQTFSPEYIRFALEKSLQRLKTDYIDIYQLHNPPLKVINRLATYDVLRELKKEGKIRAWGLSVFDQVEGFAALAVAKPDSIQVPFNIFNDKPGEELFPKAREQGCAVIAREPLANGFLTGKYKFENQFEVGDIRRNWPPTHVRARVVAANQLQFLARSEQSLAQAAIRYVLSYNAVSVAIAGAKNAQQVEENMRSSDGQPLTRSELDAIKDLQSKHFGL
jgi:aryl-alcohol dehydrogenase-like predicted oxidoreductase